MVWHVRGIPLRGWGLVLTKQGQDRVAKENLERQGVRCFMPRILRDKTGYASRKLEPLFPGYLFFQVPQGAWGFVRNTRGVRDVMWSGEKPALVHPACMRVLLKALNEENYLDESTRGSVVVNEPLVPGESVTIKQGIFKNFVAVYKSLAPADRIRVITEFMGAEREVELERYAIIRHRRIPGAEGHAGAVATKGQGNGAALAQQKRKR